MAAIERWSDEALDALQATMVTMRIQAGIEHAQQVAQLERVDEKMTDLAVSLKEVKKEVTKRQMNWLQVLTLATAFLVPMVALVGLVLQQGG